MNIIKDNLAFIGALIGAVAVITAALFKTDEKIIYNIIFLAVIFLVLLAILLKSYLGLTESQNLLYSFVTNNLLANKSKKYLDMRTLTTVIGSEKNISDIDSFCNQFPNVAELNPNRFHSKPENIEFQKDELKKRLNNAEAVIIVRTKELEETPWVYDTLEEWAFQNSHAPCLVFDKIDPKELQVLKLNPIPEKYYFIPDGKPFLAWRLLKRGNERALAWRIQASFNRLIAACVLVLLITGIISGYFINSLQKKDYHNVFRRLYKDVANQTKFKFVSSMINKNTDKLNVSYWFTDNDTLYQLSSTDETSSNRTYTKNAKSVVGCAFFAYPNEVISWNGESNKVTRKSGEIEPKHNVCNFDNDSYREIKSIVCVTYNGTKNPEIPDRTVGLCVFSESENDILFNGAQEFLKTEVKSFFDFINNTHKNNKLYPDV